jgi:NADH-quinone oxidoreductase subunit N
MTGWIAGIAAITMVVGNLLALPQKNLKRMLAYSGVAHIGYVLTGPRRRDPPSAPGWGLFYFVAYLFSNAGAFLGLAALETAGEEPTLEGVRNLVRRAPVIAACWLAFLLSPGRDPVRAGVLGEALRLPRRGTGRPVVAGGAGRAPLRGGALLLPERGARHVPDVGHAPTP